MNMFKKIEKLSLENKAWLLTAITVLLGGFAFVLNAGSAEASTELLSGVAKKAGAVAQTQIESVAGAKRLAECTAAAMDMPGVTFSKALTIGTSPTLDGTLCEYKGLSGLLQKLYTTLGLDNKPKIVEVLINDSARVLTKI
jgi:hypothetical protein